MTKHYLQRVILIFFVFFIVSCFPMFILGLVFKRFALLRWISRSVPRKRWGRQGQDLFLMTMTTIGKLYMSYDPWVAEDGRLSAHAKMPLILSSGAYLLIRDKCVIFARNCKIANSFQCNMQYIQCNSAFLDHKALFLSVFGPKKPSKIRVNRDKSWINDKIANVKT